MTDTEAGKPGAAKNFRLRIDGAKVEKSQTGRKLK